MGALADIAISQKGSFGIQKFALGGYEEMWQEGSFDCKYLESKKRARHCVALCSRLDKFRPSGS